MSHNLAIHPVFLNTPPSIRVTVQYSIRRVVTAYRLVQAVVSTVVVRGERGGGERERQRARAAPRARARPGARLFYKLLYIDYSTRSMAMPKPKKAKLRGPRDGESLRERRRERQEPYQCSAAVPVPGQRRAPHQPSRDKITARSDMRHGRDGVAAVAEEEWASPRQGDHGPAPRSQLPSVTSQPSALHLRSLRVS